MNEKRNYPRRSDGRSHNPQVAPQRRPYAAGASRGDAPSGDAARSNNRYERRQDGGYGRREENNRGRYDNRDQPRIPQNLPGIRILEGKRRRILTKNLIPGTTSFEYEEHYTDEQGEWRVLDPKRSKLGAAIAKGLQQSGFRDGCTVLYLGASHGYTPSYVSDIIGPNGFMFCLDFAPRVVRDLVFVCESRSNMAPILGDAKQPEEYAENIPREGVDVIFQDIAQKDQVGIFLKNCDAFLKQSGYGLLAVKARSMDVTKRPTDIFKEIKRSFETGEHATKYVIIDYRELDPFEKDHAFFVIKKR